MKALLFLALASCGEYWVDDRPRVAPRYYRNPAQDAIDNLNQTSQILQANNYRQTNCVTQAVPFTYPTMYRTNCN